jgi:hypothetical protein
MFMSDSEGFGLNDLSHRTQSAGEPRPRLAGAPLPVGTGPQSPLQGDVRQHASTSPPGRSLPNPQADQPPFDLSPSLQRAFSALRMALPFVQRIFPLLDGNIAASVGNLIASHPPAPPPAPPVNLEPLEDSLADLRTQHRDLRNQIMDQNSSLKRVEDQLEMVREATDRNTLEQQELLEDLKTVGNKVNLFALLALGLLAISILLNLVLYLHIQRVLP